MEDFMLEITKLEQELKEAVLQGDVDEKLEACKNYIKWHIKDVRKFMEN